jgi:lysophospholipase L1-like esterase
MSSTGNALNLTDEQFQRGLIDAASPIRLARLIKKIQTKQAITYGAIGGSITAGASAQPDQSYGPLLGKWLNEQTPTQFINAGIGASNSLFGTFRAKKDLLCHQPDLITVEYAVNDANNPSIEPGFEALIRQCLQLPTEPLIILIFTMRRDGGNVQHVHIPIGKAYDVPMLSYRDAIYPLVTEGKLTWEDLSPDEVHPNDAGHHYIFQMLKRYLQSPINHDDATQPVPPLPAFLDPKAPQYMGQVLDASQLKCIANTGWTQGWHKGDYTGWQSETVGAEITLEFTGTLAYIGFKKYAGDFGCVQATLDGKPVGILDGFYEKPLIQAWAGGHTVILPLSTDLADGTHTLTLKLLEETHPDSHGHAFDFGYLLVS